MTQSPPRLTVEFLPSAAKDIDSIPAKMAENILARIEAYAEGAPSDIKKHKGRGEFRLRVGDYGVLFVKNGGIAEIHRILHHREAYR